MTQKITIYLFFLIFYFLHILCGQKLVTYMFLLPTGEFFLGCFLLLWRPGLYLKIIDRFFF